MQGMCMSCNKVAELHKCNVCSASICSNCLLSIGCKICKGKIKIK